MRRVGVTAASVIAVLAPTARIAGASAASDQPLRVHHATLTQDGRQLVWRVVLDHSFSPRAMARDGRMLCLVVERARNQTVSGVLCVAPPGRGGVRLVYSHVTVQGPGPGRVIRATVSRSSTRELSAHFAPDQISAGYRPIRWQVLTTLHSPTCGSSSTGSAVCKTWFPNQPVLARLHVPQVVGCVPGGSPIVYHGPTRHRDIALTFDDGPWPDTPQFLAVLERDHVHATFFQIGEQISTYGRSVDRRMLRDGDMIGDHTWNHADVAGGGSFAAGEISRAAAAIRQATGGFTPCLFRAPGGAVSGALVSEARAMGFTTIQWDVDPRDWSLPGTGAIYSTVTANAHPGAIVIQHDGGGNRSETLAALPHEIDTLRHEGYRFVTVTQLLGQRLLYK